MVGLSVLLAACSDGGSPEPDDEVASAIVSSPVTMPAGLPNPEAGTVVYVSAPPGSAEGEVVTITNERTRAAWSARLTDGGFDPLHIGALEGDRILVGYDRREASGTLVRKRPPRVVRSSPGPNRTDVPLNARIEVVFSAPIAVGTVDDAVRLLRGTGERVPGEVTLSADGLIVEIAPSVLLDPETTYILEVTTDLRDRNGGALQDPVSVPFVTGTTVAPGEPAEPWELEMDPASCCPTGRYKNEGHLFGIEPGKTMVFQVLGLGVRGVSVKAGTSDADVAYAVPGEPYLTVVGNSPGRVRISALAAEILQVADLMVYGSMQVPVSAHYQVVGVDDRGRLASALLNGSRLRVLNDTITDVHSWGPMSRGRLVFSRESGGILIRELNGAIVPVSYSPTPARCVAASRDGAWVSWIADIQPGNGESWDIMVAPTAAPGQARVLKANQPVPVCPVWSPDGELVYRGEVNELWVIRPDGSNDRKHMVAVGQFLMPSEWTWGADRRLVVQDYSVRSSRADGGGQTDLYTYGLGGRITWSGDGKYFLAPQMGGVASGGNSYPLRVLVRADGLERADLPTVSLTLRDAGFVPW